MHKIELFSGKYVTDVVAKANDWFRAHPRFKPLSHCHSVLGETACNQRESFLSVLYDDGMG